MYERGRRVLMGGIPAYDKGKAPSMVRKEHLTVQGDQPLYTAGKIL